MTAKSTVVLELDDIQAGALEPRPVPYAVYIRSCVLTTGTAGATAEAANPVSQLSCLLRSQDAGVARRGTQLQGLKALGVPEESLATFPRVPAGNGRTLAELGDAGENAPEHWEKPLGSQDVHLVVVGLAPDSARLEAAVRYARDALRDLPGVVSIWQQHVYHAADLRNMFGFADGIGHPAVEGMAFPAPIRTVPLKAGEFVLSTRTRPTTSPHHTAARSAGAQRHLRSLPQHTRVAAFRQHLRQRAKDRAEEEWLAAKIVGRWPSGAPLALAPDKDNPELGADPKRNNAFMFGDDPSGLKSPFGSHVRRMNPRDSAIVGEVRLHRMIRRGTNYGPPLPPVSWRTTAPTAAHIRLCRGAP